MLRELLIRTGAQSEFVDITPQVQEIVRASGVASGLCYLFVPHTTAGLTLNENWDPDVRGDILCALNRIIPAVGDYRHEEGNSPAHVKASLVGFSVMIPVEGSRLVLGTWQGVYLAEFDGPRQRRVLARVVTEG